MSQAITRSEVHGTCESRDTKPEDPAASIREQEHAAAGGLATLVDSPTVLIIDDDTTARLTLSCLLGDQGYRLVLATSADNARARLESIQPDVILCDLVMGGTNGDQFCRWLKEDPVWRYVPVIAVTQLGDTLVVEALLEAGADDVVTKPVKGRELQARVAAAMRTRRRYRDLARPI